MSVLPRAQLEKVCSVIRLYTSPQARVGASLAGQAQSLQNWCRWRPTGKGLQASKTSSLEILHLLLIWCNYFQQVVLFFRQLKNLPFRFQRIHLWMIFFHKPIWTSFLFHFIYWGGGTGVSQSSCGGQRSASASHFFLSILWFLHPACSTQVLRLAKHLLLIHLSRPPKTFKMHCVHDLMSQTYLFFKNKWRVVKRYLEVEGDSFPIIKWHEDIPPGLWQP